MPNKQRYPNDPERPMNANAGNRDNKDQDNIKHMPPEPVERDADKAPETEDTKAKPTKKHAKT